MKLPWFFRPATLMILALAAIASSLWSLASTVNRWEDVSALAFSPDSKTLVAGTYDGKHFNENFHWYIGALVQAVALFDAKTGSGRVLIDESTGTSAATPAAPPGQFVGFSPDGNTLAVGTWDGTVRLWDPKSRLLKDTLQAESPRVAAVAFSSDGRTLVAGYRCWFTLWETAKYGEGKRLDTYAIGNSFAISPTMKSLACDRMGGGAEMWDTSQEKVMQVNPGYEFRVFVMRFSPDGRMLAMGGEKSGIVWDIVDNSKRFEFEGSWIRDVAFSPDGRTLASAGEGGLRFWSTEKGFPIDSIRAPQRVRSVAFSPDGRLLATGDYGGSVTVWDIDTGKKVWSALVEWPWKPSASAWASGIVGLILFLAAGVWIWKEKRSSAKGPAM